MSDFDFAAMQAQGNTAGVAQLYALIMTPLPLAAESVDPTALEVHYEYMHRLIEQGKVLAIGPCIGEPSVPGQAPVPPGIGILQVASRAEAEEIALSTPFDPMAGGFPVPPMPGQEFTFTSRRAMAQGTTIVQEPVTVAPDELTDGTEEDHHA